MGDTNKKSGCRLDAAENITHSYYNWFKSLELIGHILFGD